MNISINKDELKNNINSWVTNNIGESFTFREYQFDTIFNICLNILEGVNHTQIIEAPTGSGKSLINIISAGVLASYYNRSSYILCSDLYLWKQYEDYVNKHSKLKTTFGIIKGQTGNYTCVLNNEDIRNADCKIAGIGWGKLFNSSAAAELGYDCVLHCHYVNARKQALKSKVVIMTYQLYHYMINIVANSSSNDLSTFKRKDIIFCDECHNIPQIMANCFKPIIKLSDFNFIKILHSYRGNLQIDLFNEYTDDTDKYILINRKISLSDLETKYENIFNNLCNINNSPQQEEEYLNQYNNLLNDLGETVDAIESNLSSKKQVFKKPFTKEDIDFYRACSWYRNTMCFWSDFNLCVNDIGMEYIVKDITIDNQSNEKLISFMCVKEDYISWKYLLNTASNRVLLSATIGGYNAFTENIGASYLESTFVDNESIQYSVIPSTFDFSKSPIYFLNRYKMSYKEKEHSFESLKPIIYNICKKHFSGKRGMIQTGSYSNAKKLYDEAPPDLKIRMLLYNNAKEKTRMITMHQMSHDTILIGPTLVEGIDLPGDQCRFIIILKVPYPIIVNDYVKKKIQLFPLWYNSVTSNTLIQGIGRGNRFKDDYCITYILDACFLSLYNNTKDQYSKELQERIKIYN